MWYQCYHSKKYPVIKFVHIDNAAEINSSVQIGSFIPDGAPNANSTMIGSIEQNQNQDFSQPVSVSIDNSDSQCQGKYPSTECSYYNVGHISHIPRQPPTPATYTIPSINNNSTKNNNNQEDFFGLIKLKDNDVCYTSGIIEWVGRKRSFPINSGFKILSQGETNEPLIKKIKRLNKSAPSRMNNIIECDCADVLPTVNAIVDHLNALHEAVDLVDLRLNTLEGVISKNK